LFFFFSFSFFFFFFFFFFFSLFPPFFYFFSPFSLFFFFLFFFSFFFLFFRSYAGSMSCQTKSGPMYAYVSELHRVHVFFTIYYFYLFFLIERLFFHALRFFDRPLGTGGYLPLRNLLFLSNVDREVLKFIVFLMPNGLQSVPFPQAATWSPQIISSTRVFWRTSSS